ncbi:TetR/AcrR family transcriptional regulator [Pseudaminobacter sp. NGMCC 1.201702]|uniref:TetR/AcrR family transcriptional regulator n=1 Tax=Pseudaminobacter sp. NGMCC 1.201702 TaxID=3391825 RepID=UPI0039EDED23
MDQKTASESGWRGSPEVWLETAYESLVESGVDSVRILPLAKKLNLSRTSFYWFFKDREELLSALVERWRTKNTGNLVKRTEAYAESIAEAVLNVFDCWVDREQFDSRFEFAIRSWALQSSEVALATQQADTIRIDALTRMFLRFGFEEMAADVRARTVYLTQIGYISMNTLEDLPARMARIPAYVETFTGKAPSISEMERFFSRHGYVPGS